MSYGYDANGNLTQGDGKSLSYTAFNKPETITAGGITATFDYGADLSRYKQEKSSGETILYIDKLLEIVTVGGTSDYRHYLGQEAILTKVGDINDPYPVLNFTLRDRLGSVVTITDEAGTVQETRGYDPFGKPRDGDWAEKVPPVIGSVTTDRGFTDHEHLNESQLIHMNGRAYDYQLGRFLSVDPIIQSPGNSQSLNPYSYIMNNPLAGTDPSGYSSCAASRINSVCETTPTQWGGMAMPANTSQVRVTTTLTDNGKVKIHLEGGTQWQQQNIAGGLQGAVADAIGSLGEIGSGQQAANVDVSYSSRYAPDDQRSLSFEISILAKSPALLDRLNPFSDYNVLKWGKSHRRHCEPTCDDSAVDPSTAQMMADMTANVGAIGLGQLSSGGRALVLSRSSRLASTSGAASAAAGLLDDAPAVIRSVAQDQVQLGTQRLLGFLSESERAAFLANPSRGSRFIGTAVHRATAQALRQQYPGRFNYNATRSFDFIDLTTGQAIELTTVRGVASHTKRGADVITYVWP